MRLISGADDEVFGLASAAAKLGRAGKLLDRLAATYRADPGDPDTACRYGLALMATVRPGIEAHARFTTAIEVFGEVLAGAPEHWLARYSRARLRALIPSSYGSFTVQAPDELGQAAADLDTLLAQQAAPPHRPYFASTHALAAVVARLAGDKSPGRRPAHLAALGPSAPLAAPDPSAPLAAPDPSTHLAALVRAPRVPAGLPALGAILCEPLVTLYAGETGPEREAIGELMSALYGDQRAVREARQRQSVR